MKSVTLIVWFLPVLLIAGCGTGDETVRPSAVDEEGHRGVTTLVAEHPEKLREVVMDLIGEGPESEPALEIVDRYESDLRFVLDEISSRATVADSAASSSIPQSERSLENRYMGNAQPPNPSTSSTPSGERIRRFAHNSLSVATIGLNECHQNFIETGDVRFARRGLAHGYIALVSEPSPAQKSLVIEKMKVLQEPLLK